VWVNSHRIMAQGYTRSVTFQDGLRFYGRPLEWGMPSAAGNRGRVGPLPRLFWAHIGAFIANAYGAPP
jgi:hypothetical protein